MKRNTQIATKVLDVGEDKMKIRTDVMVTRETGYVLVIWRLDRSGISATGNWRAKLYTTDSRVV
jgi:hypothetical protein